jgi:hypothetical protein
VIWEGWRGQMTDFGKYLMKRQKCRNSARIVSAPITTLPSRLARLIYERQKVRTVGAIMLYPATALVPGTDMPTWAFMNEKINSGSLGGKIMTHPCARRVRTIRRQE